MFICIVSRGRTHGVLLRICECRVRKIINCCRGGCGRSRPFRGCRVSRGTRPTHHRFRAAAGADADLGRSAPRVMVGPRIATPGAGQIVKEQMHAEYSGLAESCSARFIPYNTQGVFAPFVRGAELRRKSNRPLHFRHLLSGLFRTRALPAPRSPLPAHVATSTGIECHRRHIANDGRAGRTSRLRQSPKPFVASAGHP